MNRPLKIPFCTCGYMLCSRPIRVYPIDEEISRPGIAWTCPNEECMHHDEDVTPLWMEVQVKT